MLLITDANIFIDLDKIGLLNEFDKLNIEIATSDFVFNELNAEQKKIVKKLNVNIYELSSSELMDFFVEYKTLGRIKISSQDYSIYYFAKKYDGKVLSNDKPLRTFSKKNKIEVKGVFYVLDLIIKYSNLDNDKLSKALSLLLENNRLPKNEINKRLEMLI